ncbi:MAG: AIPR family protein [Nannocystaceae bacterium]|nr:AIPR family protein [Nannocystaceae bacterium]
MTLNLSIVHQQVENLVVQHKSRLGVGDIDQLRSRGFTALVLAQLLDLPMEDALDLVTDGGNDGGIDALAVGAVQDAEFVVTLVQTKYKRKQDGRSKFPASEIPKIASTVAALFDPDSQLSLLHPRLLARVEEIRSLVRDGNIPSVRIVLANNGERWGKDGDALITATGLPRDQVRWDHVNHEDLVRLMRGVSPVTDQLQLAGQAVIESFDFCRVLVGKVPVAELARLFETHGDALLERNVRRYLGTRNSRVNRGIRKTLRSAAERERFYFYNNGVTITCSKFRHNALQSGNHLAKLEELQVINGGQTCHTIRQVLAEKPDEDYSRAFVLVRVYELDADQRDLVHQITYATNSQNPVDLRDLRANDDVQRSLQLGLQQLGYWYSRKREAGANGNAITPAQAGEAVLAVLRRKPHLARNGAEALFGRHYNEVFNDALTPAEVVGSVQILRRVRARIREDNGELPRFTAYAVHFLGMLVADGLPDGATDRGLDTGFAAAFDRAVQRTRLVLAWLGIDEAEASLQRLSGTFRKGELLEQLSHLDQNAASAWSQLLPKWTACVDAEAAVAEAVERADQASAKVIALKIDSAAGVEAVVEASRIQVEQMRAVVAALEDVRARRQEQKRYAASISPTEALVVRLLGTRGRKNEDAP